MRAEVERARRLARAARCTEGQAAQFLAVMTSSAPADRSTHRRVRTELGLSFSQWNALCRELTEIGPDAFHRSRPRAHRSDGRYRGLHATDPSAPA